MNYIWTEDLQSSAYKDALKIRKIVFVEEQNVPLELEIDDLEEKTIYVTGYLNDMPAATARIYEKSPGAYKVQRVALLKEYRGKGLGIDLMNEIKQYAAKHNGNKLILDAQDHALPFYKKLGYTICSEGFMDAGIPHHSMELILQSAI